MKNTPILLVIALIISMVFVYQLPAFASKLFGSGVFGETRVRSASRTTEIITTRVTANGDTRVTISGDTRIIR